VGNFTSKMWVVQPQYSLCTAFGAAAAIDNPPPQTSAACDLYLYADTKTMTITGTPVPATGGPDVACEMKVTVPAGNCEVVIRQQSPGKPNVEFANVAFGGKGAIKVTWKMTQIAYEVEGAVGSICGEPKVLHKDGEYSGSAVLRGYKSAVHAAAEQVAIKHE
jgi:hypothetical protein